MATCTRASGATPSDSAADSETLRAFTVVMAPDPVRVSQMRRVTEVFMQLWAVSSLLTDDVQLVVSELVTNAIEHGYGTIALRVRNTDSELCIEVTDENPEPARLRLADDEDLCGRGLFLVDSLASKWGVSGDGRTAWALFRFVERRS